MTFRSDASGFGGCGGNFSPGPMKVSYAHARQTDSFSASNLKLPPLPSIPLNPAFGGWLGAGTAVGL